MAMRHHSASDLVESYDHLIKILLLGDSAVGKSSLLLRFCENKFESSFVLTIGVDFKKKIVTCGDKKVKLQVWDTAGQERFRTITPAYFRSAMGVVMVYDITNFETFENIRYWMRNVLDFGDPDVLTVLVGNKTDLGSSRQVRTQQGKSLADEFSSPFFETSAKSGSSVETTFMSLACAIVEKRFQAKAVKPLRPHAASALVLSTNSLFNEDMKGNNGNNVADEKDENAAPQQSGNNDTAPPPQQPITLHKPSEQDGKKGPLRRCCG